VHVTSMFARNIIPNVYLLVFSMKVLTLQ
jgi:hypothetical protein